MVMLVIGISSFIFFNRPDVELIEMELPKEFGTKESNTLLLSGASFNPEDTRDIGYEFLDDNKVVHIWNTQDDYFFDVDSGIQLTNHYEDYWTRNIFCIGYYNNDEWNKINCADELTGFNKDIDTDSSTFVEAVLWKDIEYNGYNLRLGV